MRRHSTINTAKPANYAFLLMACVALGALAPGCTALAAKRSSDRNGGESWEDNRPYCPPVDTTCGASSLARVTAQDWSSTEIDACLARAAAGTVAVQQKDGRATLAPNCRLDGKYSQYKERSGSGSLWATNRVLLRTDEVGPDCAGATHVIAAYARKASQFEAILVPLPCPPIADTEPADHCIAAGQTGPQRLRRARAMQAVLETERLASEKDASADVVGGNSKRNSLEWLLEQWGLAPDDYLALQWLGRIHKDCGFDVQAAWLQSGYHTTNGSNDITVTVAGPKPTPQVLGPSINACDWAGRPVFVACFPAIFAP